MKALLEGIKDDEDRLFGSHEMILVTGESSSDIQEDKAAALIKFVEDFKQRSARSPCILANPRRRRPVIIVFVRTTASARKLQAMMGPPVHCRSAKQKKNARHAWKPKGQGRIGGRSEGPRAGHSVASVYKVKGVGVLHPKSSESEEAAVCRDVRSGKLKCVIVAESGRLGCGDPLWLTRECVGLVVAYDISLDSTLRDYAAMSSYGACGPCGCHGGATDCEADSRCPTTVSFACPNIRSELGAIRALWTRLEREKSSSAVRLPPRESVFSDTGDFVKERLRAFYRRHNPEKSKDEAFISTLVARCDGNPRREAELFEKLRAKYEEKRP